LSIHVDVFPCRQSQQGQCSYILGALSRGFRRVPEERVPAGVLGYSHALFRRDSPWLLKDMVKEVYRKDADKDEAAGEKNPGASKKNKPRKKGKLKDQKLKAGKPKNADDVDEGNPQERPAKPKAEKRKSKPKMVPEKSDKTKPRSRAEDQTTTGEALTNSGEEIGGTSREESKVASGRESTPGSLPPWPPRNATSAAAALLTSPPPGNPLVSDNPADTNSSRSASSNQQSDPTQLLLQDPQSRAQLFASLASQQYPSSTSSQPQLTQFGATLAQQPSFLGRDAANPVLAGQSQLLLQQLALQQIQQGQQPLEHQIVRQLLSAPDQSLLASSNQLISSLDARSLGRLSQAFSRGSTSLASLPRPEAASGTTSELSQLLALRQQQQRLQEQQRALLNTTNLQSALQQAQSHSLLSGLSLEEQLQLLEQLRNRRDEEGNR
jgi:hypothetical protein